MVCWILTCVLQEARCRVFTPAGLASPLARKPYDCRHADVPWRLNAEVPAPPLWSPSGLATR
jgi:hypothetical protein